MRLALRKQRRVSDSSLAVSFKKINKEERRGHKWRTDDHASKGD
jgi:hypothetical protein